MTYFGYLIFIMTLVGCRSPSSNQRIFEQNLDLLLHPSSAHLVEHNKNSIIIANSLGLKIQINMEPDSKSFNQRDQDLVVCDSFSIESSAENVRIALDPGHIGGSHEMKHIEEKSVRLKDPNGNYLSFSEADLTLGTALHLKERLRPGPYEIFMTRTRPGETSFGKTFTEWMKEDFLAALDSAYARSEISDQKYHWLQTNKDRPKVIFHSFFKNLELIKRTQIIDRFKPDLILVIHYNVHSTKRLDSPGDYLIPTKQNYHLAFVPGSFMPGEFSTTSDIESFRFLFSTTTIMESIRFSESILKSLESSTGVSVIGRKFDGIYPLTNCIYSGTPGIYSRNMVLTRLVRAPVCYIELLCQDNLDEAVVLQDTTVRVGHMNTSVRVIEVADALYQGIINYVELELNPNEAHDNTH